jgi:prepilin-type N-terminal cleavage/methylation domain-containing protein
MVQQKLSLKQKLQQGFTLLEILTVMAILGILATLVFSTSMTGLKNARDARRKEDLLNISKALESYITEVGEYPDSITYGGQLQDPKYDANNIIYMRQIPQDPIYNSSVGTSPRYSYVKDDDSTYRLYTCLENNQDKDIITPSGSVGSGCQGVCGSSCNYGIASTNTNP